MHPDTTINPLLAFTFTVLLVVAVLIGSAASTRSASGGLSASAGTPFDIAGRS